MPDVLRFGIIGTGCIGQEHIRNLLLLPNAAIVAVADTDEPSRKAALADLQAAGVQAVTALTEYAELIALQSVDAIIIATPNFHHIEVFRAAAASGKHVLVEKPLAIHAADCAAMVAASESEAGGSRLFWCAMEYRYIPAIARLIREAAGGAVGEARMLTIREHRFPFLRKVGNWNRFNARTGGTLVEKCCHFFDLMRLILRSEPTRIFASGGHDVNHLEPRTPSEARPDILDNAYVVIEWASGARSMLELCMFAEASKNQEELSLVGTRGKLEAFAPSHGQREDDHTQVNFRYGRRNEAMSSGAWDSALPPSPQESGELVEAHEAIDARLMQVGNHAGATHEELRRFTDAALAGATPEVSLRDGAMAAMIGVAAQTSIERGVPVLWAEMADAFEAAVAAAAAP